MSGFSDNPYASEQENAAAFHGWETAQFQRDYDLAQDGPLGPVDDDDEECRCAACADTCRHCGGLGFTPGSPNPEFSDVDVPCPDGCPLPSWLECERSMFAQAEAEVAALRARVAELEAAGEVTTEWGIRHVGHDRVFVWSDQEGARRRCVGAPAIELVTREVRTIDDPWVVAPSVPSGEET